MKSLWRRLRAALPALLAAVALVVPNVIAAQTTGSPQGLRPYWHVFAAYAIAIVLVGGWAVSIARRLRDVERRLWD